MHGKAPELVGIVSLRKEHGRSRLNTDFIDLRTTRPDEEQAIVWILTDAADAKAVGLRPSVANVKCLCRVKVEIPKFDRAILAATDESDPARVQAVYTLFMRLNCADDFAS